MDRNAWNVAYANRMQERIERRALVCNLKIAKLIHTYDVHINNTFNPIGEKGVNAAVMALLLATH